MRFKKPFLFFISLFSLTGCFSGTSVTNIAFSCLTGSRQMDRYHFEFKGTKVNGKSLYSFNIKEGMWDYIEVKIQTTTDEIGEKTFVYSLANSNKEVLYSTFVTDKEYEYNLSHIGEGRYYIAIECSNHSGQYSFRWGK